MKRLMPVYLMALLVMLYGCKSTETSESNQGIVSLHLTADSILRDIEVTTKASTVITPNDFRLWIENTKGEVLKQWNSYADVPAQFHLNPGSYKMVAQYADLGLLPKFSYPVYGGESKFNVAAEQKTTVNISAAPIFTKVQIDYKDEFWVNYQACSIDVKTTGDRSLNFPSNSMEAGYFEPGVLKLRFNLTAKDGTSKNYYWDGISTTQKADFYRIHINSISNTGNISITINTDNTTQDITINESIPDWWLPKAPPIFRVLPSDVTTPEGKTVTSYADIVTNAGIKHAIVRCANIPELAAGVDIITATAEQKQALKTLGLDWSPVLDDPLAALELKSHDVSQISFTKITPWLNSNAEAAAVYPFELVITDKYDQNSPDCRFNITVGAPVFNFTTPNSGNLWTRAASFDLNYSTERPDSHSPVIEYSTDGTNWISPSQIISTPKGQDSLVVNFNGLTPATTYKLRARMGIHIKPMPDVTTASEIQLPNNNFAVNHETNAGGRSCFWFFAADAQPEDQWWGTRNGMTTSEGINANYTRYSGARPNANGIELVTCGWGSGNTASGGGSAVKYVSAGAVFLGTLSKNASGAEELHGKEFGSRPTAMTFDLVSYAPKYYNNVSDQWKAKIWAEHRDASGTVTEIARGELSESGEASNQTKTVELTYSNERLPITHLCVAFYSGSNETWHWIVLPAFASSNPGVGSKMIINNIQLVYGK